MLELQSFPKVARFRMTVTALKREELKEFINYDHETIIYLFVSDDNEWISP